MYSNIEIEQRGDQRRGQRRDQRRDYRYPNDDRYTPEEPSLKYVPTPVIREYIGQVINTYIPGYGRENVYVKGIDRYGMVSLVIFRPKPKDYISVHNSDIVGIYPPTI